MAVITSESEATSRQEQFIVRDVTLQCVAMATDKATLPTALIFRKFNDLLVCLFRDGIQYIGAIEVVNNVTGSTG